MATRGRGAPRAVRPPPLGRSYLSGSEFPDLDADVAPGEAGPSLRIEPDEGDYVGRMHRSIKLLIRASRPRCQYARRQSFNTLIDHLATLQLLEKTDRTEPPLRRGAGTFQAHRGRPAPSPPLEPVLTPELLALEQRLEAQRQGLASRPASPHSRSRPFRSSRRWPRWSPSTWPR